MQQGGLKIADLGHLQAAWHVHREWVERLEEEQFRQGDMEKQLRLPVSALMDRTRDGITKMQARLLSHICPEHACAHAEAVRQASAHHFHFTLHARSCDGIVFLMRGNEMCSQSFDNGRPPEGH